MCRCLMVFNATFNNISVISWRSVLLVEETGGPGENTELSQVTDKLYHIMLYTSPWSRFKLTTSVVIGTDCIVVVNKTTIRSWPQTRWFLCDFHIGSYVKISSAVQPSWSEGGTTMLEQSKNSHFKMKNYTWLLILNNYNILLVKNYLVSKLTQI
jgi:hypothetical protein